MRWVSAALNERRTRFDPARMCAETLATLDALERAWMARAKAGDRESKALLRRIRRQRSGLISKA